MGGGPGIGGAERRRAVAARRAVALPRRGAPRRAQPPSDRNPRPRAPHGRVNLMSRASRASGRALARGANGKVNRQRRSSSRRRSGWAADAYRARCPPTRRKGRARRSANTAGWHARPRAPRSSGGRGGRTAPPVPPRAQPPGLAPGGCCAQGDGSVPLVCRRSDGSRPSRSSNDLATGDDRRGPPRSAARRNSGASRRPTFHTSPPRRLSCAPVVTVHMVGPVERAAGGSAVGSLVPERDRRPAARIGRGPDPSARPAPLDRGSPSRGGARTKAGAPAWTDRARGLTGAPRRRRPHP